MFRNGSVRVVQQGYLKFYCPSDLARPNKFGDVETKGESGSTKNILKHSIIFYFVDCQMAIFNQHFENSIKI